MDSYNVIANQPVVIDNVSCVFYEWNRYRLSLKTDQAPPSPETIFYETSQDNVQTERRLSLNTCKHKLS